MPKHRRPTRLARWGKIASGPAQVGIAAGVVSTVAVTGSVVAAAAPGARPATAAHQGRAVAHVAAVNSADVGYAASALALKDAVSEAKRDRAERIARAKARAEARRKAAAEKRRAERAAEKLAQKRAERRAAEKRAAEARTFSSASRGFDRMSASAASVLQIAAAAASGAYYAHGGTGPNGFDCSGFTSYVFAQVGVSLPHSSSAQRGVVASVSNPQPGDLVFVYNGGGGSIGHVGIYAGGGYWWEASNPSSGVGKHRAWSSSVSYGRVL